MEYIPPPHTHTEAFISSSFFKNARSGVDIQNSGPRGEAFWEERGMSFETPGSIFFKRGYFSRLRLYHIVVVGGDCFGAESFTEAGLPGVFQIALRCVSLEKEVWGVI